jgi:hypothetical protein
MSYGEHKDNNGFFYKVWRDDKGLYHREDGPAYLCYRADGMIIFEYFYVHGLRHREDGPAVIWYDFDGLIEQEAFYLNGEDLNRDKVGFWNLWIRLTYKQRQAPSILKYLARFS